MEVATLAVTRFREDIEPADRRQMTALVRKSHGDPRRLTANERRQLLELIRRIDVQRLGRDVTALVGARKLRQRLRR